MKLRSADDLSDLDLGVFIAREEIKKMYENNIKILNEIGEYEQEYICAGIHRCKDLVDQLLDIATLGDIASTKEQLNEH